MTPEEVAERFIEAAAIERRLPRERERPEFRSGGMPAYVHSREDMNQWGAERLKEWRQEFWSSARAQVTAPEVTRWEECLAWTMTLLDDPDQRRALWAWARAQAGGMSMAKWCRLNGIHPETGARRKVRAINRISAALGRSAPQHTEIDPFAVLAETGKSIYFSDTFEADAYRAEQPRSYTWRDDPSLAPIRRRA